MRPCVSTGPGRPPATPGLRTGSATALWVPAIRPCFIPWPTRSAARPRRTPEASMTLLHHLTGAPPGMTTRALMLRLAGIGAVLAGTAGVFTYAGGWLSPDALTPARVVDRFEQVN